MKIKSLTNQITHNRLLRAIEKLLKRTVFEFNDNYTRLKVTRDIRQILEQASAFAINDYQLEVLPYVPTNPHYMEVRVGVLYPTMIHYVYLNINNVD